MAHAPNAPPPWTPPVPHRLAHIPLVTHAWSVVDADGEAQVKRWRAMMQEAFLQWRDRHGTAPTDDTGPGAFGLLGNPYIGRPVQQCPPYVCAGPKAANYFDLLMMLVDNNDPGVAALIADITLYKALAVLVLAEVNDHPSGALEAAYAALRDIEVTDQRSRSELQHKLAKRLLPLAEHSQALRRGGPDRKGKMYGLKAAIAYAVEQVGPDRDAVLRWFENTANTDGMFMDKLTDIRFQGVEQGRIQYIHPKDTRDNPTFRAIPKGTLGTYLSLLRNRPADCD
jgi:hypothetical protein